MSQSLSQRYGVQLDRITCNLYRDGKDSVAWHGDRVARNLPEATVAILSLGEPRLFRVRPKGGGTSMGWPAGRGDLIGHGRLVSAHPRPQGGQSWAAYRGHVSTRLRLTPSQNRRNSLKSGRLSLR
jgi:hypothetical protein